jgi:hypothetical protein
MSGNYDPRWGDDSRDRYDDDRRDRDEGERRSANGDHDPRDRRDHYEHELERDHGWDTRDRVRDDPRDVLLDGLDLPRGLDREVVWDREQTYELNGDDSRSLATVGAFRVVPDSDLLDPRSDSLDHLRDEGLVATIPLDDRDRGVVLTDRGRELLEMHRRDRDDERGDRYGDRVNRRELTHDASVYDAYRQAAGELRERVTCRHLHEVQGIFLQPPRHGLYGVRDAADRQQMVIAIPKTHVAGNRVARHRQPPLALRANPVMPKAASAHTEQRVRFGQRGIDA